MGEESKRSKLRLFSSHPKTPALDNQQKTKEKRTPRNLLLSLSPGAGTHPKTETLGSRITAQPLKLETRKSLAGTSRSSSEGFSRI